MSKKPMSKKPMKPMPMASSPKMMADGGEAEDSDNDMMMDQCAMELMDAIEKKDKDAFISALHALFADLMMKMQPDQD